MSPSDPQLLVSTEWLAAHIGAPDLRVLDALGLKVNRLIRTAYGPFQLGALAAGAVEEIPRKVLKEQLGKDALG